MTPSRCAIARSPASSRTWWSSSSALCALAALALAFLPAPGCTRDAGGHPAPAVTQTADSGPVSLRLALDRAEINPAETVRLSLTIAADEGCIVEPPEIGEKLGDFSVVAREEGPVGLVGARSSRTYLYTLEPFLPGEYTIPAIEVPYRTGPDAPRRDSPRADGIAATQPVTVRVVSILPEGAPPEPGPARGVVEPAEPRSLAVPITLAVVCAAAFSAAGALALRRRRAAPPAAAASADLAILLARAERGEAPPLETCNHAAGLLRRALSARIPGAAAMTTEQLLAAAPRAGLTAHELEQLRSLFQRCDAARYAAEPPDHARLLADLRAAVAIAAHLEQPAGPGARP
ncbi:MAG: BatD family protein [Phycisphaerales bacterium]